MKRVFLSLLILSIFLSPSPTFAQERPDLTIISPKKEETIFGDKAVFSFFVSNFLFGIDGYLRLSLDQKEPLTIKEQKDFPLTDLCEGNHTLVAELVDKKHRSLSPVVKKEVVFLSILPKEEKGVDLKISPSETKEGEGLMLLSLALFGLAVVAFLSLAFKFYINTKTSQDRSHQKPLG